MLTDDAPAPPADALTALLDPRSMTAVEWGLDRIRDLLAELGNPQTRFASVHIAGTNGKGSTAAFVARILAEHEESVGVYLSPHLEDVRERFRLDGGPVPEAVLQAAAARVLSCAASAPATYFEAATALAFEAFERAGVAWAAVETGLGGRWDATNVLTPRVSAITTIGLDHPSVLGDTIRAVAGEKAGILKPGVPAVAGVLEPEARAVVAARAAEVGAPIGFLGDGATVGDGVGVGAIRDDVRVEDVRVEADGTLFRLVSTTFPDGRELRTSMTGRHQADNAALAVMALEAAGARLDGDPVAAGIESARLPGRYEVLEIHGTRWVLDMAHNREATAATLETLRRAETGSPRVGLVGILADKPWRAMLEMLRVDMDAIILTEPPSAPSSRRWDAREAARVPLGAGRASVAAVPDLDEAIAAAREAGRGGVILVTGSAHTVGDARTRLLARSAAETPEEVGDRTIGRRR